MKNTKIEWCDHKRISRMAYERREGEMKIIIIKAVGDGLPIIEESSYYLKFETIPIEFPILQDFGVDMVLKKNSYFDYRAIFLNLKGKEVAAYDFKASNDKEILRNLEYCVSRFIAGDWNTRSKLKESDLSTQSTDAADVSKKIREMDMRNVWWR